MAQFRHRTGGEIKYKVTWKAAKTATKATLFVGSCFILQSNANFYTAYKIFVIS